MIRIGDMMPDFEVSDQDGNIISSRSLIGRKTILYFYPKDNTSGCTAEACNLRDNYEALQEQGYNVVGVSKDSVASHKRFQEKHSLPFTLLSDPTTRMLQTFGAWGEKQYLERSERLSSSMKKVYLKELSKKSTQKTTQNKFLTDKQNEK